ncbi:MAG: LPS translocon maturation chaperone LptM, partial [Aestuariivirgaceae bacterium]
MGNPLAALGLYGRKSNQFRETRMSWCRLIVLAGILFTLGACGVRGDLDPPPDGDQKSK